MIVILWIEFLYVVSDMVCYD